MTAPKMSLDFLLASSPLASHSATRATLPPLCIPRLSPPSSPPNKPAPIAHMSRTPARADLHASERLSYDSLPPVQYTVTSTASRGSPRCTTPPSLHAVKHFAQLLSPVTCTGSPGLSAASAQPPPQDDVGAPPFPETSSASSVSASKRRRAEDDDNDAGPSALRQRTTDVKWPPPPPISIVLDDDDGELASPCAVGSPVTPTPISLVTPRAQPGRPPRGKRPRPFKCGCGQSFSKREHLRRHDRLIHKVIRPYKCGVCDAHFGTKQNMEVHFRTKKHRLRKMAVDALRAQGAEGGYVGSWEERDARPGGAAMGRTGLDFLLAPEMPLTPVDGAGALRRA